MQLDLKSIYIATSVAYIILGVLIYLQSYNYKFYFKNLNRISIGTILLAIGLFFSVVKISHAPIVTYLLGDALVYGSILIIYQNIVSFQGKNKYFKVDLCIFIILIALTSTFSVFHTKRFVSASLDSLYFTYFFLKSSIILTKYSYAAKKPAYIAITITLIINTVNSIVRFFFTTFRYEAVDYWSLGPAEIVFMMIYFINFGIFILGLSLVLPIEVKQTLEQSIKEKESALAKNKLLIREMNHRVKNNLTTIQGLLQLQSFATSNRNAKTVLTESANRIKTISDIHSILTQNTDIRKIDCGSYFQRMVNYFELNFKSVYPNITVATDLGVQEIDIDLLIPIALIVNELLTNAYKHAFKPEDRGTITLKITHQKSNGIALMVKDTGKGLPADFKAGDKSSFGMDIVSSLVTQLDGTLDFHSKPGQGTQFKISFKTS